MLAIHIIPYMQWGATSSLRNGAEEAKSKPPLYDYFGGHSSSTIMVEVLCQPVWALPGENPNGQFLTFIPIW